MAARIPGAPELAELLADDLGPPEEFEETGKLRSSAVLLPLLQTSAGASLLFTRRSQSLPHHRGQVAFPGGIREEADRGPYQTALREAEEEVGVDPTKVKYLARLTPTETLREFRILPVLSLWPEDRYKPNSADEVERVFTVPLIWLMDPHSQKQVILDEGGLRLSVPAFPFDGEIIWGATFRMTQDFLSRLRKALL